MRSELEAGGGLTVEHRRILLWTAAIVGIVVFRLALTGDREILATNSPHDEFWYIHRASRWIFAGQYDVMTLVHLPIFAMWLDCLYLLGIPARLGIDLAWLTAIGYLAFSVQQLTRRMWVGAVVGMYLAFHPFTIAIFDRALPETLLTVLSAAALGAGIELWNCRGVRSSWRRRAALIIYVVGFAVAYHTRKEGVVMIAPLLLLGFISWMTRSSWWSAEGRRRLAIPLLVGPLIATLFLATLLAFGNYLRWGSFARIELEASGFKAAMSALASIDVGRTPRQVTVSTSTRVAAYAQSRTFGELRPFLEQDLGRSWVDLSAPYTDAPGEIADGWFLWALRDAASAAGWHKDPATADAKYSLVSAELNQAFESGRLRRRALSLLFPLDPDLWKWLGFVPGSTLRALGVISSLHPSDLGSPREDATLDQLLEYARVAGRRSLQPRRSVEGWVMAPSRSWVGLARRDRVLSWSLLEGPERPDVPGGYPFSVSALVGQPTELVVRAGDGRVGTVPLESLSQGKVARLTGTLDVPIGIDALALLPPIPRIDRWSAGLTGRPPSTGAWSNVLCPLYGIVGHLFWILIACSLVGSLVLRDIRTGTFAALLIAGGAVTGRALLLGMLDASSWNAMQTRYLLPVVPPFACMAAISLGMVPTLFGRARDRLRALTRPSLPRPP